MNVTATSEPIKITLEGSDLVKDLGLAIGFLSRNEADPENVYLVHKDWIEDPLTGFANLPDTKEQRDAVVHVFDDIWADKAVESPLIGEDGTADENKWLPIPTGKPKPKDDDKDDPTEAKEEAEAEGEDGDEGDDDETPPESPPSGLFFVPEILEEQVELGLGFMHETKTASGNFTLSPYAFFPILAMPFPNGNPFVFGKEAYPVPVGADFVFPEKSLNYAGEDYNGFRVNVNFVVRDPSKTTWAIYLKKTDGDYTPFQPDFSDLGKIVNQLLAFGAVKDWLDKPLAPGKSKVSIGEILLALDLLSHTNADGEKVEDYLLGTLDLIKDITFPKLFAIALQLLVDSRPKDGLQLLELGEDKKEGLFIKSTESETGGKDYGFNFVLTDIELGKKTEDTGGEKEKPDEKTGDTPGDDAPAAEEGNKLTLQIGKVYEKDPPKVDPGGDPGEGEENSDRVKPIIFLAEEEGDDDGEEANWTNSEEPLGINLFIVNIKKAEKGEEGEGDDDDEVKAADTNPEISFAPRLDLVSIGFDYKSADDEKPIASGGGFSFTGIEPRAFVSFQILPELSFKFGAAVRVDHIELPLDATTGNATDDKNPVASNLVTSKADDKAEAGDKTTPAPRTRFSFAAGYTPIAKEGTEQHHVNIFLYNAENERTTETIWWKVEKSFGPIALAKLGLSWANTKRELGIYLSGGLDMSGLKIELDALSITMPLTHMKDTRIGLKGMSVYFKGGAVEISGGFLELEGEDGTIQYDGEAEVKAASFGLSAIGSYASIETDVDGVKENHTSLFVFAVLNVPLGGPPVFFVTGLAGGFGYNRDLLMPSMDDLPTFPLVQAAMADAAGGSPFKDDKDPAAALKTMAKYIPPSYGEYWLGVGIKFTSFEVIQSFAMLSVAFGTRFEIDILGLSAITMPPALPPEVEPIGFAELALKVTIAPDTGIFGLEARLTPQSYILSKDCHITGGFAFYIWAKDNPEKDPKSYHAGDFVITLGGYNSHYKKPDFFPEVPRLGFNWQVSKAFTIKGGIYFALTSTAVMAGGSFSAVYQSGSIRAWFAVYVDFLLGWKPFYYYIEAGITLGASITVEIIVTITISISVGVQVALWGPSFGGKAKVDLWIISFTIRFGSDHPDLQPIGWDEFKTTFLPPQPVAEEEKDPSPPAIRMFALAHLDEVEEPPTHIDTDTMCSVRPAPEGLIKDLSQDKDNETGIDWIINPEGAAFITQTAIPATSADFTTGSGDPTDPQNPKTPVARTTPLTKNGKLIPTRLSNDKEELTTLTSAPDDNLELPKADVGPCEIPAKDLLSHHGIYLYKLQSNGEPDYAFDFQAHGVETPSRGNAPRTTWNKDAAMKPCLADANSNPLTVEGTLTGFVIESKLMDPDHTRCIDVSALQYVEAEEKPTFSWSDPGVKTVDPKPGQDGTAVLMDTINDAAVTKRRAAILANLASKGIPVAAEVQVADLAESADKVLLHAPTLMAWE